jgi:hypothetical protein
MKQFYFGAILCVAAGLAVAYATVGGQYSVNVHFVPPLVTGTCSVAQFWSPPNVTCALCFCMTGTLSRCIPQPGCNPMNATTTTAQPSNSTTSMPTTTTPSPATAEANHKPTQQQEHVTAPSAPTSTSAPPSPPPSPDSGEVATPPTFQSLNLVRRRRRAQL